MNVNKKVKSSFLAKHIAKLSTWSFILITIIFYSGFYPGQTWARNYSSATSRYIYDFKPAKSREYQLLEIGKQEFYNYNQGLGRMEHELQVSGLAPTVSFRDLKQIYLQAVQDAKNPAPSDIWKELTGIVEYNDKLIWKDTPGKSPVLVTLWTDWEGYKDYVGKSYTIDPDRYLFVSISPELQNFCKKFRFLPQEYLILRLEQLMGLPPNQEYPEREPYTLFVEFFVNPEDLFRPSRDPEITDYEASLVFPQSTYYVTVDEEYKTWFEKHIQEIYIGDVPFPFTQLGYTYDWGNPRNKIGLSEFLVRTFSPDWGNPKNKVGLSEFVIRPGSTVEVVSVTIIDDYCDCSR